MADNSQKVPFALSMNRLASKRASDALSHKGNALPCSIVSVDGSIVTVKFEIDKTVFTLPHVKVAMFGPEYVRYPTQVGDKGFLIPADARLGGVNGLGSGTADLSTPGNLDTAVFMPVGNKAWPSPEDPNKLEIYGIDGVVIKNSQNGNFKIDISESNIVLTNGAGATITVSESDIVLDTGAGATMTMVGNQIIFTGVITVNGVALNVRSILL